MPDDHRLPPEQRLAVFLDFYEFHLRHRAHPGAVYYLMPWLADVHQFTPEQRLWFALINGHTQNPLTSFVIFREFPDPDHTRFPEFDAWFAANRERCAWDTDRRYHRRAFPDAITEAVAAGACDPARWHALVADPADAWRYARSLPTFGRLSAWSYLEYVRVMGWDVDVPSLMLDDWSGSRSHRNGLCILAGLDELDWRTGDRPDFEPHLDRLGELARHVLLTMRNRWELGRFPLRDVGRLTLESTLCTFKGWHRPNRRYPNVYNDMLHDRIRVAKSAWIELDWGWVWQARANALPSALRLELDPYDPGVHPIKQNWYLQTGEVPMLGVDWPEGYPCGLREYCATVGPFRAPATAREAAL
jgi:Alpha-glutamyl/putrescinyl thymine pyrophosphorylase clade 2